MKSSNKGKPRRHALETMVEEAWKGRTTMNQPRDLAPIIGRMVVSGEVLEGEKLADYLQQMPYDDFVSLMEDMTLVGMEQSPKNGFGAAGAQMQGRRDTASGKSE